MIFTTSTQPPRHLDIRMQVLLASIVFLRADEYLICQFPHNNFPPSWPDHDAMRKEAAKFPGQVLPNALCSVSNVTPTVLNRDQTCY